MELFKLHNRFALFFVLISIVLGLFLKHDIYEFSIYAFFIFVLLFIIGYIFLINKNYKISNKLFVFSIVTLSLLIKLISVYIMEKILLVNVGIPFLSYNDDYVYDVTSTQILNNWKVNGLGFYKDLKFSTGFYSGYPTISAFAKLIFGDHYLVPRFLNVFFSTLTVITSYKILNFYCTEKIRRNIIVLLALSPIFIVYSTLQLKDTILVFLVSLLVLGACSIFKNGVNFRNIVTLLISISFMLFFRAATLLPFIVAILLSYILTRPNKKKNSFIGIKNIVGMLIILYGFVIIWDYFHSIDLLGLNTQEYFDSRISTRGEVGSAAYEGSNNLSKIGPLAILAGPILILFSLFLPTPVFVKLNENINSINYHFLPTVEYYAILPMVIIGIIYVLKNYKINRIGIFLFSFIILYKIGQAGGKSIFDSRQSLPALYLSYFFLGFFDLENPLIKKLWKRYRIIIIVFMLIIMFGFTYTRMLLRQ